jgi:hypothetical protein
MTFTDLHEAGLHPDGLLGARCVPDTGVRTVRPAAGRTLAKAVPHGRFVLVHRMGHLFSAPVWPQLVSEIERHAT